MKREKMSTSEEKLLIAVSRLRNLLFRDLESIFRCEGLTMTQFSVLEVLYHKGSLSVGEIQSRILGTNGNIPLVIKNLERDGLVHRCKAEEDARISIISLTEEGKQKIAFVYPLQQERLMELFEDIPKEKQKETASQLLELYQAASKVKDRS